MATWCDEACRPMCGTDSECHKACRAAATYHLPCEKMCQSSRVSGQDGSGYDECVQKCNNSGYDGCYVIAPEAVLSVSTKQKNVLIYSGVAVVLVIGALMLMKKKKVFF